MKLPKVLVFTVTYDKKDYCFDEFIQQLDFSYPKKYYRHIWIDNSNDDGAYAKKLEAHGLDVIKTARGNNAREAVARSQNIARKIAIEENYEYLLSIESDMFDIPKNIIQHLIGRHKDVVGCYYTIGDDKVRKPCITVSKPLENGMMGHRLLSLEEADVLIKWGGVHNIVNCGLGCTLIKKDVFVKTPFKYYPNLRPFSDAFFANDVIHNGFKTFVDVDVLLEHKNYFCSAHVTDR